MPNYIIPYRTPSGAHVHALVRSCAPTHAHRYVHSSAHACALMHSCTSYCYSLFSMLPGTTALQTVTSVLASTRGGTVAHVFVRVCVNSSNQRPSLSTNQRPFLSTNQRPPASTNQRPASFTNQPTCSSIVCTAHACIPYRSSSLSIENTWRMH